MPHRTGSRRVRAWQPLPEAPPAQGACALATPPRFAWTADPLSYTAWVLGEEQGEAGVWVGWDRAFPPGPGGAGQAGNTFTSTLQGCHPRGPG